MLLWRASGRIEVRRDGQAIALARQPQRLVAALLVARGSPVDPMTLAERLWDDPRPGAVAGLRVTVNRLRAQLGPESPLQTLANGYQLDVDHHAVDLWQFEHAADSATAATPAQQAAKLEAALGLWHGAPFGELRDVDWTAGVATHLEEVYRSTRERWAALSLDLGRHLQIIPVLEQAVAEEPFRERRWWLLMLALYRSGRQADALRVFARARRQLVDEMGIEPGRELVDLEARILRHDPTLDLVGQSAPLVRATIPTSTLLGRRDERAHVLALLGRHRAVVLVGLGGIGKTRLALAVAANLEVEHVFVELASLTEPNRLASALAEGLGLNDDGEPSALLARAAAELEARRAVLVLDNCEHLADAVSRLAHEVLQAAPNCRVVLTSRIPLHIGGSTSVVVGPLPTGTPDDPGPAALIVADRAGLTDDELRERWDEIEAATRAAGGVPLALELAGRALGSGGRPERSRIGVHDSPVAAAVHSALDDLPVTLTNDLALLAHLPAGFSVELAGRVLAIDSREVRYRIDGIGQRGLVVPDHSAGRLRFSFLEPVRDELRALTPIELRSIEVDRLAHTVRSISAAAVSRWTEPFDRDLIALLDDEQRNVQAILADPGLADDLVASLVTTLVSCWRHCGRIVEAHALADRGRDLHGGDDRLRAELLIAPVLASTSFASRAVHLDSLNEARDLARVVADRDLELRVMVELTVGYGWSGDIVSAAELLTELEDEFGDHGHPWTASSLRRMRALLLAITGQRQLAVEQLISEAELFEAEYPDYSVSTLFLAANLLRIAGDEVSARSVLTRAAAFDVDRFSASGHAKVALELARVAVAADAPDAEALLRRAAPLLDRFGDTRSGLVCRRDLGRWLLTHGDQDEARNLLLAVIPPLLVIDRLAAATAVAALARCGGTCGHAVDCRLASAAIRLETESSGSPLSPSELADIQFVASFADQHRVDDVELISLLT